MARTEFQARTNFEKFRSISNKFLDVNLTYLGSLNNSQKIKDSISSRKPVVIRQIE